MPIEIEVNKNGLKVYPAISKKKKLLFTEAELLRGLTPKKAHADEVVDIHYIVTPTLSSPQTYTSRADTHILLHAALSPST